jgi:allantoinase
VHAESEELTRALAPAAAGGGPRAFLDSRPVRCELEAIARVLALAEEARARLHIVHVSSGSGVRMAADARRRGVDVSIETCPHYLFFTDEDVERCGVVLKCAPPLRAAAEQEALWRALLEGDVDIVGSDHSPTEPSLKHTEFSRAWGGIAGVQSTLAVLLERGYHERGLPPERIVALAAAAPARRFRIAGKGAVAVGYDADLVLLDLSAPFALSSSDLHQRHKTSPYEGRTFRGRVRRTVRRGRTIFSDGHIVESGCGRFVRPQ